MKSVFGGDPSLSHWGVGLWADKTKSVSDRRALYRQQKVTLIAAGFRTEYYFQFKDGDVLGDTKAKAQAQALATKIERQLGIKMAVRQGFFA